jgi:Asp-tRNA(Asn)/Glu-tRNA(Gln) amidotransferase A subunit family amidase
MKMSKVKNVESVIVGKKYSSSVRGRIVNISVNGKEVSSLTVGIIGMKEGWSNKDKEAIKMWNKVNSKLSKNGSHIESLDGKEFKFELVNVD